ncbi:kinase-like protein [Calocera viscosa TUFC12733]|uniref:Kinase-like protein n=1 Tax=Calocera viscosa (strain TUFC12733) TaxID=1330018 RepID=A0A167PSA9_CALVF|nr:kinase-like protein [Calocera viscosa TUFC12733]
MALYTIQTLPMIAPSAPYDELTETLQSTPDVTSLITRMSRKPVDWGAHGDIYRAYYNDVQVAIKAIRMLPSPKRRSLRWIKVCIVMLQRQSVSSDVLIIQSILRELKNCMRLSHRNILEFYGVCDHGPYGFAMVSPWMQQGDVARYLLNNPKANRSALILDIAQALSYLHSFRPPLVHGDLRARNVLVRDSGHACLADFGLSRVLAEVEGSESSEASASRGNARWMAPERLAPDIYGMTHITSFTPATDVYSFGMVIYEIFTDQIPFCETRNHFSIPAKVLAGDRPLHPGSWTATEKGLSDTMWGIAQDCWKENWKERPRAEELVRRLEAIVAQDAAESEDAEDARVAEYLDWYLVDPVSHIDAASPQGRPLNFRLFASS